MQPKDDNYLYLINITKKNQIYTWIYTNFEGFLHVYKYIVSPTLLEYYMWNYFECFVYNQIF